MNFKTILKQPSTWAGLSLIIASVGTIFTSDDATLRGGAYMGILNGITMILMRGQKISDAATK